VRRHPALLASALSHHLIGGLYGRHTVTAASRPTGAIKTASRSPPP